MYKGKKKKKINQLFWSINKCLFCMIQTSCPIPELSMCDFSTTAVYLYEKLKNKSLLFANFAMPVHLAQCARLNSCLRRLTIAIYCSN